MGNTRAHRDFARYDLGGELIYHQQYPIYRGMGQTSTPAPSENVAAPFTLAAFEQQPGYVQIGMALLAASVLALVLLPGSAKLIAAPLGIAAYKIGCPSANCFGGLL
jgi:hypothetical protein